MPEVHVIGELAGALGFPRPKLYARYEIVLDTEHWHIMQGHEAGYTQVDETSGAGNAVWNHPIDAHLGTESFEGWPKMLIEVWSVDECDRSELAGYGMCYIPSSPGSYDLDMVTWRPQGTLADRLSDSLKTRGFQVDSRTIATLDPGFSISTATLLGAPPHLTEVGTAASGADRFPLTTETAGTVLLHVEVLTSGFVERNVRMGTPRAVTCL